MWYLNGKRATGNSFVFNGYRYINPTREQYLAAGYVWIDDGIVEETIQERNKRIEQEFEDACELFKSVCLKIQQATGLESFKGGFEEMPIYQATEFYNTVDGLRLAVEWSAANELCIATGKKLGYGQPKWWRVCWGEDTGSTESIEQEETDVTVEPIEDEENIPDEYEPPITLSE